MDLGYEKLHTSASGSGRHGAISCDKCRCLLRAAAARIRYSSTTLGPNWLVAWEHRNIPLLAEALGYSDSNPEFKHELEKCHSKQGGWPSDSDFDFVYTFSYGAGSDRLIGFSCRHEGVTPFIPADAVRQLQQTRRLLSISH